MDKLPKAVDQPPMALAQGSPRLALTLTAGRGCPGIFTAGGFGTPRKKPAVMGGLSDLKSRRSPPEQGAIHESPRRAIQ